MPKEKVIEKVAGVWIEEYKSLASDIGKRVELQQKNLSLHLIFLSAIASYIFKYGLDNGFDKIISNEVLLLLAIAPFISQVFTWRHLDHDSNIIDKACYIENIIAPNINLLLEQTELLGFEKYLAKTRKSRTNNVGIFAILGNDHTIAISYALLYLIMSWGIIFKYQNPSNKLIEIFFWLIVFDTVVMAITIYMVIQNTFRYKSIVKEKKTEEEKVASQCHGIEQ